MLDSTALDWSEVPVQTALKQKTNLTSNMKMSNDLHLSKIKYTHTHI